MNKKNFKALIFFILFIVCSCLLTINATAQQDSSDNVNLIDSQRLNDDIKAPPDMQDQEANADPSNLGNANVADISRMSLREFNLSLVILVFGFIVLMAEFLLLRKVPCNAEQLLRIFGITLIVMGALLIIPAGFNAQAIAPAMGLLGTIAGYLLSQRSTAGKEVAKD